ncbi:MAG: DUF4153 domain-containing protein [Bacteroidales bacterium]|jgi:hypothetical protein|nr:DUF4153 domain-containing protein [Bacteroidales bacterium]
MKKIKLSDIPAQIRDTVVRFPVAVFYCTALAAFDILMLEHIASCREMYVKLNLLLPLGFALALAVRLLAEDLHWSGWRRYADVLTLPLLAIYYFLLDDDFRYFFDAPDVYVYAVCCLAALTGLCTALWHSLAPPLMFWTYNIKIGTRALFAAAYALIFIGALCLALLTVGSLFEVRIHDRWYQWLVIFFCAFFAPVFFAVGVPRKNRLTDEPDNHHAVLHVLGQYVLLPVLLIYFLILSAYGLKIIIAWQLPKGWVSGLALAYSAAGLLIYFLLHRLYITGRTKIATLFGRWFFYSELPVVALLFVAIYRRTADYGITESRYYLWVAACWLLGVSLYMIFTKGKSFRPVLLSLAAAALLSVAGPWSAFSVSDCSQINRLRQLMTENDLLKDGKYVCDTLKPVKRADYSRMENITDYFVKKGNARRLQTLFTPDVDSLVREEGRRISGILLGREESLDETGTEWLGSFTVELADSGKNHIPITGYRRLSHHNYLKWDANEPLASVQDSTIACKIKTRQNGVIELYRYGVPHKTISLPEVILQITAIDRETTVGHNTLPREAMSAEIDPDCKIVFIEIQGVWNDHQPFELEFAEMYILEKE